MLVPFTCSHQHYVSKGNLCDFMYIEFTNFYCHMSFHYGNVPQLIFPFILANISDIFYDFFYYDQDCY